MTENQHFSKIAISFLKDYAERGYENAVACIDWLKKISQEDSTCSENQGEKNPCETCEEPRLNCQNFPCEKKKNFEYANKVEDEEYDGEDYGIDSLFHAQRILEKTLGKVDGYQSDDGILEHKCAISAVKKLYEQKPIEWSEEDEKMLNHIISIIEVADEYLIRPENIPIYRNWLKSLKSKVQSKHEWSEEDERTYKSIMYSFAHNYPLTIQQQEFIKSLRPQNHWKPSNEQMIALSEALGIVKMFTPKEAPRVTNLQSLYNDLKKII